MQSRPGGARRAGGIEDALDLLFRVPPLSDRAAGLREAERLRNADRAEWGEEKPAHKAASVSDRNLLDAARYEIEAALDDFGDQDLPVGAVPSVGSAVKHLESLSAACFAVFGGWKSSDDRQALASELEASLEPFCRMPNGGQGAVYGAGDWLTGNVPCPDGSTLVSAWGQLAATFAGEPTLLRVTLDRLSGAVGPSEPCLYFLATLGSAATNGALELRAERGAGKGKGGAPLHRAWAEHDLVVDCAGMWLYYSPSGRAPSATNDDFVDFVELVLSLATRGDGKHGGLIRNVMSRWRNEGAGPRRGRPQKQGNTRQD